MWTVFIFFITDYSCQSSSHILSYVPICTSLELGFCYVVVCLSSGRSGNKYKQFLWSCTVRIKAIWVTQHSACSSPLSTEPASMRRFSPLLQNEGEWQRRTVKYASFPVGTCHFLSFKNTESTSGVQAKWWTPNHWDAFTWTFSEHFSCSEHFTSSIGTPLIMTNGSTLFHFHPFIQIFDT